MRRTSLDARTYTLACHGCGRVHEQQAYFMSSPLAVKLPDGRVLGVAGCPDCLKVPGRIRAAYQRIQNGGPILPPFTDAELGQERRAVQSGGALTPGDVAANDRDAADELEADAKPRGRRPADTRPICSDCGKPNETAGHQDCQYPQDHP